MAYRGFIIRELSDGMFKAVKYNSDEEVMAMFLSENLDAIKKTIDKFIEVISHDNKD